MSCTAKDARNNTATATFTVTVIAVPVVTFERLKSFGFPDQAVGAPYGSLIQGRDGALYGTTYDGGSYGMVQCSSSTGTGSGFLVLKSFSGSGGDGSYPHAALVQGTDGALYGTTDERGNYGGGTVFKINPNGSGYTVLKSFSGSGGDGSYPFAALVQGTDGALYGTTYGGGSSGYGTVFKLNPELNL